MAAPIHSNITILDPDTDPALVSAMVAANTTGRDLNNEAVMASRAGDFALALSKHLEALPLKTRAFGEASVQAAITFNGLGETYLRLGDLELAGQMLGKALHVRNEVRLGGLGLGPPLDGAVSRDNLGRVLEAAGRMGDARVARLAGNLVGSVLCGNFKCHVPPGPVSGLAVCQACEAVFYCGPKCQRVDWVERHKPLCLAHTAEKKLVGSEEGNEVIKDGAA